MRINTNVSALNTHRVLSQTNTEAARSIGRLSSGFRINRAADDAAGLAIANKFKADIRSLKVAQQNTTEATSMLQVAEGNTNTISNILGRMKELATQASSYNASTQTSTLDNEFSELKSEIDRIVGGANYQGVKLLDGSFSGTFQIGATNHQDNQLAISLTSAPATTPTTPPTTPPPAGSSTVDQASKFANGGALGTITWGDDADLAALGDGQYTITATDDGTDLSFEIKDKADQSVAKATFKKADSTNDDLFELKDKDDNLVASFKVDAATFNASTFGTAGVANFFKVDPPATGGAGGGTGGGTTPATGKGLSIKDLSLDTIDLTSGANAQSALTAIDTAIDTVNSFLGTIGATQNRLDYAAANIATTIENYSASESAIRDADMAAEMVNFTRNQIMQQAATAMLAQANSAPQGVLRLLS